MSSHNNVSSKSKQRNRNHHCGGREDDDDDDKLLESPTRVPKRSKQKRTVPNGTEKSEKSKKPLPKSNKQRKRKHTKHERKSLRMADTEGAPSPKETERNYVTSSRRTRQDQQLSSSEDRDEISEEEELPGA